ncbi:hypothetical protein EST38_g6355 [Candolleomyces aberdarensis]|uniref:Aminoglycoside phosphotransferase domain-containing protein n=1 Tax=Candolleomyces aberdarensis TaxID=2316362 RepID=A0A4Q2DHT7_9AGAR|nr:hypothetical protein EST38_g6355 [Candolleomyces aberdarensis]
MPIPTPSSESLSLTSGPTVEAYLANTPFACQSVTCLTGGTINYLYRIQLLEPLEGSQTLILKHAQQVTKVWEDTTWDLKRQASRELSRVMPYAHSSIQIFEVEAMTRVRSRLSSDVVIPKIHHLDVHNHVIIMEDCGPDVVTLTEYLSSRGDAVSPETARDIGVTLGEFLASMHDWSRSNPDGILDLFDENTQAKDVGAEFYYDRVAPTLDGSDKSSNGLPPLPSDLQVDRSNIQLIPTLAQEYRSKLFSDRVPGRDVVSSTVSRFRRPYHIHSISPPKQLN